jgi:hypothetical protein
MFRMIRFAITRVVAVTLFAFGFSAQAQNALLKPPPNCATVQIGKVEYVKGEVFLSSHEDTAALKIFGFRELEYLGRSVASVKYAAIWPINTDLKALPQQVSGLNYDAWPGFESASVYSAEDIESSCEPQTSAYIKKTPTSRLPYRKTMVRCQNGVVISNDWGDALIKSKSTKKELDEDDEDYSTRGNFFVRPVNKGFCRRVESVTTKDHPAVGMFHVRPAANAGSFGPADFKTIRDYSAFGGGQTFFTSPGNRQNGPRTMSLREWQQQNTAQRRR